ncbi:hypothetical protein MPCS_01979 (plasmid) [Candidatus Megaera polyxenophila]|nr:hypothetical protein MPCS_01979 [Candidatus Megaera polyxenophila]
MPATSGSYSFSNIKGELIIRKAYELIGMPLSMVTAEQYNSALNIINFILSDWTNSNVNLWTLKLNPVFLTLGQASYPLPSNITKIFQVFLRGNVRQLNGTPQSNTGDTYDGNGGGIAAYAFDGNPATRCTQNVQNGNISYDYGEGVTKQISIIGIQSYVSNRPYSLVLEASQDTINWFTVFTPPPLYPYKAHVISWFYVSDPIYARAYRIRETGGYTLDIEELYFNSISQDTTMSEVSRYEYLTYPNKSQIGRPTIYYVDYQRTPSLYIWQTAAPMYNLIMYSGQSSIETLENYTQGIDIPAYFYTPLIYGLASMLAAQYAPEKEEGLKIRYQETLNPAVINNTTEVPLKLEVYSD